MACHVFGAGSKMEMRMASASFTPICGPLRKCIQLDIHCWNKLAGCVAKHSSIFFRRYRYTYAVYSTIMSPTVHQQACTTVHTVPKPLTFDRINSEHVRSSSRWHVNNIQKFAKIPIQDFCATFEAGAVYVTGVPSYTTVPYCIYWPCSLFCSSTVERYVRIYAALPLSYWAV